MSERIVLGIDEAGRGSVLGPLVVGGVAASSETLPRLLALGVRDSKQLTPRRRDELYDLLGTVARRERVVLGAPEIDAAVERRGLNRLEAEAFAELVRRVRPALTYVDACDTNAGRFGALVSRLAGGRRVVARHHADRDLPIVAAASIVAKVERDREIEALGRDLGRPIGSGYPSDPTTVAFVAEHVARPARPLPWLRQSWATVRRLKAERTVRPLERSVP